MAAQRVETITLSDDERYSDFSQKLQVLLRPLVRLCQLLKLPPDVIWLGAGFSTLVSGFFFLCHDHFLGFFFLFAQIYMEGVGNALTVHTKPTLLGEYFNEIIDFVGLLFITSCIAMVAFDSFRLLAVVIFWPSVFLQNTYYKYYAKAYIKALGKKTRSLERELTTEEAQLKILPYLRKSYLTIQHNVDKVMVRIDEALKGGPAPEGWYTDKQLLSRQSLFCRPAQWIVLSGLTLLTDLGIAVIAYLILSLGYGFTLIGTRMSKYPKQIAPSP